MTLLTLFVRTIEPLVRYSYFSRIINELNSPPNDINVPACSCVTVKRFEKFSLNFSMSLFVIRVNLRHP